MDFEYQYSPEQEKFRQEVRTWLDQNVPQGTASSVDPEEMTAELFAFAREMRRKLGRKGWLNPTFPKAYGGGGLTSEHEVILDEELERRRVPILFSNPFLSAALLVWGTEEQRQKFLTGLLTGEIIAYQAFTEPQSGSDLANIKCTAVHDGDDWIINGVKCFVTGPGPDRADILFGPIMTDPTSPRHRNLGYFIIPGKAAGVKLVPMRLLNGNQQHFVYFDNVRVSAEYLIGGERQGWQVTMTSLEEEHGGRGRPMSPNAASDLITYVRRSKHNGGALGQDPFTQQQVVDSYIESHIAGLLAVRNYSMFAQRQEMSYHGSQTAIVGRETGIRNNTRARDIVGLYGQLGTHEPGAPFGGWLEVRYGRSLPPHAGGTLEVQKTIVARRIGISRTQERAAPTPATATKFTA
ncbi:MAG: acyl-CoA dehydrogenase family protein [Chloroflexi bacterium]|nr:acyl-CoA dehydrogenase family protein [Chloroflexota bacterium]